MKKTLFLLFAVLLCFASCSKEYKVKNIAKEKIDSLCKSKNLYCKIENMSDLYELPSDDEFFDKIGNKYGEAAKYEAMSSGMSCSITFLSIEGHGIYTMPSNAITLAEQQCVKIKDYIKEFEYKSKQRQYLIFARVKTKEKLSNQEYEVIMAVTPNVKLDRILTIAIGI